MPNPPPTNSGGTRPSTAGAPPPPPPSRSRALPPAPGPPTSNPRPYDVGNGTTNPNPNNAGNNYGNTGYTQAQPPNNTNPNGTGNRTTERSPLLNPPYNGPPPTSSKPDAQGGLKARIGVWTALVLVFVAALVLFVGFGRSEWVGEWMPGMVGQMPRGDVGRAAEWVLERAPVIDGHIDLPILVRSLYHNNATAVELDKKLEGHVDIPRLREGRVGGFFWSVYVGCPGKEREGKDYLGASWRVRDTLEQIDISHQLIAKYPSTFSLSLSSSDVTSAISHHKIASLLGVEGGHQLGNSLAVLRMYYELGVRYMTLTHTCHNAFADSGGYRWGDVEKEGRWGGLSKFGPALINEMNRLGMIIDLSHTSDLTAIQALKLSRAPVMWSHSSARGVRDGPRNVPDGILEMLGTSEDEGKEGGKKDGVVMVNFAPFFIADEENGEVADVKKVADHVEHIAKVAGKKHVGIGSDFDGIGDTPKGLEDVSKYPALIAELISRNWTAPDLGGLTGGNFLRVFRGVERVAREIKEEEGKVGQEVYWKRRDL